MKVNGKVIKTSSQSNTEFTYYLVDTTSNEYYKFHQTLVPQAVANLNKIIEAEVHTRIKFVQKIY